MGESYLRPPLTAREPRPRWIAVWRFRLVALLLLAVLAVAVAAVVLQFVNTEQNPGLGAARPAATLRG